MRSLVPLLTLFLLAAACGDDDEVVCVREYSDRIDPLFDREKEVADEYALFLREAETGDALMIGSRADLLARYAEVSKDVDAVPTPCASVKGCHSILVNAITARLRSLERLVEVETLRDELVEIAAKIEAWETNPDVGLREQARAELLGNMGPGRRVVFDEARKFVELSKQLQEAAGGEVPEAIANICRQSARLMLPLDRADNPEAMVLVLRGGLDQIAIDHALLLERARIVTPPAGRVAEVWVGMLDLLARRQEILSTFVGLQEIERETRRLDARLTEYDGLLREQAAAKSRIEGSLRAAVLKDRVATQGLLDFQTAIQKLRARVL